jgi:hypothetical protein
MATDLIKGLSIVSELSSSILSNQRKHLQLLTSGVARSVDGVVGVGGVLMTG